MRDLVDPVDEGTEGSGRSAPGGAARTALLAATQVEKAAMVDVALGRKPADLYIRGAKVCDVYTGRILEGLGVALAGRRVAYVGPAEVQAREVLEADGRYLIPGLIDAHAHADFNLSPPAFAEAVVPRGTTAVLTEVQDLVAALGPPAIEFLTAASRDLPMWFFFSLPSSNPALPGLEGPDSFPVEEIRRYAGHPLVLALGEITPWPNLLNLEEGLVDKIMAAEEAGLLIEGHATGCSRERLSGLIGAGITSCHESISPQDVELRLSLGLYCMLRHGSIRRDLPQLAPALTRGDLDLRRAVLTPDWMNVMDIIELGYMDSLVRDAVALGVPPVEAVRMATLNPATYLGLDRWLGGIAPGRLADLVLVDDLAGFHASVVIFGGRIVAREGRLLEEPGPLPPHPEEWPDYRRPRRPFHPEDFRIRVPREPDDGLILFPVIRVMDTSITRRLDLELPVRDGYVVGESPAAPDLMKVCLLGIGEDRLAGGFVTGFGGRLGGLAQSMAHEHHRPIVIGADDADMALAWRRMLELGGGFVYAEGGRVVGEVALPIGGMQTPKPAHEAARELRALKEVVVARGCNLPDPFLTLGFLTQTGLPFLRITPSGVYDVREKKILFP